MHWSGYRQCRSLPRFSTKEKAVKVALQWLEEQLPEDKHMEIENEEDDGTK